MTAVLLISPGEALAELAEQLFDTDAGRVAFGALSSANQDVAIAAATNQIAAVVWRGVVLDIDQTTPWPRMDEYGNTIDPDPDDDGTELVASLPKNVRTATALQAAHVTLVMQGSAPVSHIEHAVAQGATSVSSGGGCAIGFDARIASRPWARLCPKVQTLLTPYRAAGGELL